LTIEKQVWSRPGNSHLSIDDFEWTDEVEKIVNRKS